jgi:excisionase family DNA binding protein
MHMSTLAPFSSNPCLTPQEAADYLRTGVRTLERWRRVGGGPVFVKIGRRVGYRLADLESWVSQQRREHTGASGAPASPAA